MIGGRDSILWLGIVIGGVSNVVLELFKDGDFYQIEGMPVTNSSLLFVTVVFLGPPVMALLSQTLADKANRWANIIVGAVYGIVLTADFIASLALDPSVLVKNPLFAIVWLESMSLTNEFLTPS